MAVSTITTDPGFEEFTSDGVQTYHDININLSSDTEANVVVTDSTNKNTTYPVLNTAYTITGIGTGTVRLNWFAGFVPANTYKVKVYLNPLKLLTKNFSSTGKVSPDNIQTELNALQRQIQAQRDITDRCVKLVEDEDKSRYTSRTIIPVTTDSTEKLLSMDVNGDLALINEPLVDINAAAASASAASASADAAAASAAIIDPTTYYTKTQADALLDTKLDNTNIVEIDTSTATSASIYTAIDGLAKGSIVFFTNQSTVLIDRQIKLKEGVKYIGADCTFKRANEATATTTASIANGDVVIPVDVIPTQWTDYATVDRYIYLSTAIGHNNNTLVNGGAEYKITNIAGLNITVGAPLVIASSPMASGATVREHYTMFYSPLTSGHRSIEISGIKFDGNRANNADTDWLVNDTLNFKDTERVWIHHCDFFNSPCESIVVGNDALIDNNTFNDLGGSCVHTSSTDTSESTANKGVTFRDNRIENVNISYATNSHGNHAFQFSNAPQEFHIYNNIFKNGNIIMGAYASSSASPIKSIHFHDNQCYDFNQIADSNLNSVATERVNIHDNNFFDCGDAYFVETYQGAGGALNTDVYKYFRWHNNTVKNGRLVLQSVEDFDISHNHHFYDAASATETNNHRRASIAVWGSRGSIADNKLFHYSNDDNNLQYGIYIYGEEITADDFYGVEDIIVHSNNIKDFANGIRSNYQTFSGVRDYNHKSLTVSNNQISRYVAKATNGGFGLYVEPGMHSHDNHIAWPTGGNNLWGLYVEGVDSNADHNRAGGISINDIVRGTMSLAGTDYVVRIGQGTNKYNVVVDGLKVFNGRVEQTSVDGTDGYVKNIRQFDNTPASPRLSTNYTGELL